MTGRVADGDWAFVASQSSLSAQSRPEASIPCAWPLCGFAPGGYMGKCDNCGQHFEGAKRSSQCLECAVRSAKSIMENGNLLRAAAVNLHDTIVLWSDYGGPTLPVPVKDVMRRLVTVLEADPLASAMSAGTAETAQQAQGQSPASAIRDSGDAQ